MKRKVSAAAAWALAICLAMEGSAAAGTPEGAAPLTLGALCLRQPKQELVQFSGALTYGLPGRGPAPMLYQGGAIGLLAGVITQGVLERHIQNKEKQGMRDAADRVLEPYRAVLLDFTNAELMRQALEALETDGSKTLLKFTDPPGAGLQIESVPAYYMTQDARSIVLENTLMIRSAGANPKAAPLFNSVVKIVAAPRTPVPPGEQDSWISNQGEELRALAIDELRESLNLALAEVAHGSDRVAREFRNVHYVEGNVPKMEHAQVIADLPDHIVLKTLRGWVMSVPVGTDEPGQLVQAQ
jgi:hypothetical protein